MRLKERKHRKLANNISRFNLSFWSAVIKMYPSATLCWWIKMKRYSPTKLQVLRLTHFTHLLETNLLPEIIVSQVQTTFICSVIITVELSLNMFWVNNRRPRCHSGVFILNFKYIWHIVLVSFLLTLNR